MKKNMGNADRIIRILLAVVVIGLYFGNIIPGILAIVLLVVSGIFILTSFVGFCPLYSLVGIKTCPTKTENQ